VTSGAVAAGMSTFSLAERPKDLATVQASAAVGQSKLMQAYATVFGRYRLNVAQLLLTHSDLDSRIRRDNARNTLERVLAAPDVVPIINENDSVAVEELNFGDNDRLSAEVAILAHADLLIILTQVDGVLDEAGAVIPVVRDVDQVKKLVNESKGRFSVGGMISKLEAVKMAVQAGIPTVIVNGRRPDAIAAALAGNEIGTRFLPRRRRLA
jgi:glutamate 5-kinase